MTEPAIRLDSLSKRFGSVAVLDDLTLEVQPGAVYGLLGQNGAGKTTTIRCMLDLLRPSSGRIAVLGRDSIRDSVEIRRRVGYLPEEPIYYPWMRVAELLRFNARFFPRWDRDLAARLLDELAIPADRRMRALSRGMKSKVGLIMALAQRPELLLLDDPTSGLDPLVRREFLEAMIGHLQSGGGTVLFSTHLVHEMERVADHVAILHEGRLLLDRPIEQARREHKTLHVVFDRSLPMIERADVRVLHRGERDAVLHVSAFDDAMPAALRDAGADSVQVHDMDLEEIFVALVRPPATSYDKVA